MLKGKETTMSLNNVLPKASPTMNSLTNVTLQWLEKPYAITVDQKTAYHTISSDSSENGMITNHLRRIYWFWNPFEENHEKLKPRILMQTCIPQQFQVNMEGMTRTEINVKNRKAWMIRKAGYLASYTTLTKTRSKFQYKEN